MPFSPSFLLLPDASLLDHLYVALDRIDINSEGTGGFFLRTPNIQVGSTTLFLMLFLAPVFVPLNLLTGWIETVVRLNPFTPILGGARDFLTGDPTNVVPTFAISAALVVVLALWAAYGLRRAEKAG